MSARVVRRAKDLLRALVHRVHAGFPKAGHVVVWGWPDWEDNTVALERGLADAGRRVVVLLSDRRSPPPGALGRRTHCVPKRSLRGVLAFLSAGHVFFTHPCYVRRFPDDVVSVNVWHGMPIKTTGLRCEGESGVDSSHVLATSEFWSPIMVESMCPTATPLPLGLPRNDRLFADPGRARAAFDLAERSDIEHLVLWLPTYRRSVRGFRTIDGTPTDSPFELDGVDPDRFNEFLADAGAFAVVKPHPMAAFSGESRWSNLILLDSDHLRDRGVSLYELLGAADVLVSDVSSVTIDYLLLDRPVLHALADLDAYGDTRGFSVESVDDVLAGPVVGSYPDLLAGLTDVFAGGDPGAAQRDRARHRSHDHLDGDATGRLLRSLGVSPAMPDTP